MKNTFFAILTITLLLSVITPQKAAAASQAAGISAVLSSYHTVSAIRDSRTKALEAYLTAKNSPLSAQAATFVSQADKNNIDWKLVAAISGVESGFGRAYPIGTYNGWGWGIYGNNMHYFTSWDDAITTISKGLREQYMNKWGATDVTSIGHIYAADPNWSYKVQHYMDEMDTFVTNYQNSSLPITL